MARRRFSPQRVRRPMFWEGNFVQHLAQATGTSVFTTLVGEANLENSPNATLVRMRGVIIVGLVTTAAVPARLHITCGIKLATTTAAAAGTLESPLTNIGSDWIWWKTIPLSIGAGTLAVPVPAEGQMLSARVEIDSKAMRKTDLNQDLVFVSQSSVITSTATTDIIGVVRCLFKR